MLRGPRGPRAVHEPGSAQVGRARDRLVWSQRPARTANGRAQHGAGCAHPRARCLRSGRPWTSDVDRRTAARRSPLTLRAAASSSSRRRARRLRLRAHASRCARAAESPFQTSYQPGEHLGPCRICALRAHGCEFPGPLQPCRLRALNHGCNCVCVVRELLRADDAQHPYGRRGRQALRPNQVVEDDDRCARAARARKTRSVGLPVA